MRKRKSTMIGTIAALGLCLAVLSMGPSASSLADDGDPTMEYRNEVAAVARAWLDALDENGFQYKTEPIEATYEEKPNRPSAANIYVTDHDWQIALGFSEPITSSMTAAEVQHRLKYFAHDGVPIPDLQRPHWLVMATPPGSRVEEGFEVLEVGPGLLKLRLRTDFFAVYGYDVRTEEIMDGSTPDEAYFQIRKDFDGDMVVTLAVQGF